ncbi:MAG: hypothetical protein V3V04_03035 [Rhizobiaceae bacterium]
MSWQKIALLILGILLLAPGLCGAFFVPFTAREIYDVAFLSKRPDLYFGAVPMISFPSLITGYIGAFLLSKAFPKPWLLRLRKWVGYLTVIGLVIFAAYFILVF